MRRPLLYQLKTLATHIRHPTATATVLEINTTHIVGSIFSPDIKRPSSKVWLSLFDTQKGRSSVSLTYLRSLTPDPGSIVERVAVGKVELSIQPIRHIRISIGREDRVPGPTRKRSSLRPLADIPEVRLGCNWRIWFPEVVTILAHSCLFGNSNVKWLNTL